MLKNTFRSAHDVQGTNDLLANDYFYKNLEHLREYDDFLINDPINE